MVSKTIPPSLTLTAFACPHCEVYTTQFWYKLYAVSYDNDQRTPVLPTDETRKRIRETDELDAKAKEEFFKWSEKIQSGDVFFEKETNPGYAKDAVQNLNVSMCYNCKKAAVWVHENLVFPLKRAGDLPNIDLPSDITYDFEEARSILNASPRGAAALLRLAVQKLCAFLGEQGKNIDDDIASLVGKGLNPLVQKSLDVVRVIGNEAVHPGVIDLRDDRDTALQLLHLVNVIAEQMISHPKSIQAMYERLPEGKRLAIDARNLRAIGKDKK